MIRPRTVAPDVESFAARTPTLLPATHTNSYAIGKSDVVLIEPATPYEEEQREWLEWARAFPSRGRDIVAILLTHHHMDHVGGADVFAKELGLPIWAHDATRTRVEVPIDRTLSDGDTIVLGKQAWDVLHTPGHAPGHVCLVERTSKAAIVGDMVASVGTILIAPGDGDMKVYLEQLERLAALDASVALPAHGDPIEAATATFRRYIDHRIMRENKVLSALGPNGASLDEILPIAYADTPVILWPIASLSLRAHLDKLVQEGRARSDGDLWYAAPPCGKPPSSP